MPDEELKMSLTGHLDELRKRLLKALIYLVIGVLLSFVFAGYALNLLAEPVGGLDNLQAIEVTESIGVYMRVALLSGFILAFPFILLELLGFVLPGLNKKERGWVLLALPMATILFVGGVAFTYFVMLPAAIPFLINFMGVQTIPTLNNYIKFVTNMMFWIGISFEMPLLVFVLAKLGIVSGSMLLKQWRIAIVVIAVLAAVVSPTVDPVNMGLLMLPLFALYLLSVILAFFARREPKEKKPKKEKKQRKRKKQKS